MASFASEVFVSAASAWEVTTKVRLGKLPGAEAFVSEFPSRIEALGFRELPIRIEHAQRAGLLPGEHKDPFRPHADCTIAGREPADRQQRGNLRHLPRPPHLVTSQNG